MPMPSQFRTVGELREAATAIAEAVFDEYWSDNDFPVDPVVIARKMGVEVYSAQLGSDVFGMLITSPEGGQIYLDSDQPEKRHRFTAAHELGHWVDRSSRLDVGDSATMDRRSDEDRGSPEEIYANEFAGNLLMPRSSLQRMLGQGLSDLRIAETFGVSLAALTYRKRVLGL